MLLYIRAKLSTGTSLEDLFRIFNTDEYPKDYRSVSDIVVLNKNGKKKAYYVDDYGFEEVPEFLS